MKSLVELRLSGTGISELPPSFGNLTGMILLELGNSEAGAGHLHIPGRGATTQFLRRLFHICFSKLERYRPSTKCKICTNKRNIRSDSRNDKASTKSSTMPHVNSSTPKLRPQSSLQELFEDLNLGDRNLVQIFCETAVDAGKIAPVITRVGVHVECICSPQKSQGSQISKSIVQ
ncbi:hypothetical protein CMV_024370 [Castanea mollissima]|uniref:Uncharacterized protein n=1 Tax=Castanea mollissima TaxID=60419 RepID=A0A8J4QN83_9ROSI|nr:hypothetical protein CMV_024370 [Castanea mollissima]